jgi:hypothetical protein
VEYNITVAQILSIFLTSDGTSELFTVSTISHHPFLVLNQFNVGNAVLYSTGTIPVEYKLIFLHLILVLHCVFFHGHAMVQAVSCRLLTTEARVQSQASVSGIL